MEKKNINQIMIVNQEIEGIGFVGNKIVKQGS